MLKKHFSTTFFLFLVVLYPVSAQLETTALAKITELEELIEETEALGFDLVKEKMSIRVAEVYLKYANWDQANISENTDYFSMVSRYKANASEMAQNLPDFERSEIILMLDEAISTAKKIKSGEIVRKKIPRIDWTKISIEGNQLKSEGKPVFLEDYTWKPYTPELNEYFGQRDGFFLAPSHVSDENGTIKSSVINDLNSKATGTFGSMFVNHKSPPNWAETKYGPGFKMREDTYTSYDIDNPGAREMMGHLLSGTVPKMVGKNYVKLGYMLTNEPHFFTTKDGDKDVWASGPVSEYSKVKFRTWLQTKHASISDLNTLWGTGFASFDAVTIDIPIERNLKGTPMWYDWQQFNFFRVSEWFAFLQSEVKKYDPNAKTHIKIMPNLWSNDGRDHGIDFETLTRQSDIIGNDAGCHNNYMWGGTQEWESHYNFEWRELCMSYDFVKSVSPNKINYNSEGHFLSTGRSRDLYQKPSYARMTYWLGYIHGLNAVQTWFWARRDDGSIRNNSGNGYAGSNNQQPRVINEVTATLMDLNSYAEEITQLQNLRKSIRIFDSKTSAINKTDHMDSEFKLYESLFFEGLSIGFATEDIIKEQDNSDWDVILIYDTEFVTVDELDALQSYLDKGGVIIKDALSLTKDEYGRNHSKSLQQNSGTLQTVSSFEAIKTKALALMETNNRFPELTLSETNTGGHKGCTWRSFTTSDGRNVISIVNIGKTKATLDLGFKGHNGSIEVLHLLNGKTSTQSVLELEPEEVLFLEVSKKEITGSHYNIKVTGETCVGKNNGSIEIEAGLDGNYKAVLGEKEIEFVQNTSLQNLTVGSYSLCVTNLGTTEKQCYQLNIASGSTLEAKTNIKYNQLEIEVKEGTAPYTVYKNGLSVLTTVAPVFSVDALNGDTFELKTGKDCEGVFSTKIDQKSTVYPNPINNTAVVQVSTMKKILSVAIYNSLSKLIFTGNYKVENGKIEVDFTNLASGVYSVRLGLERPEIIKILKK
ncbi:beta-galactosidase [Flavicella sediminum]|uniref:beta-galactosidase n=1 Tax=Flavicella sediminum TaxID=2585141 RepID=UPI001407B6B7|nr:beta-galactosidase [Flavicella sediminum]